MAEKKTWEQMSGKERVVGVVGLIIIVLILIVIFNSVTSAIGSAWGQRYENKTEQRAEAVTTQEIEETETIPYERVTKDDAGLDIGTSQVTTEGIDGTRLKTFRITYVDGQETDRVLIKEEVTMSPINEVTAIGIREPYVAPPESSSSDCDPNYSGCVPVAFDVDCGGGSGDGPAYLHGTAQVIGSDVYGLDRDGDGVACE